MTVTEMRERKVQLGYTNEMISELSGVCNGTILTAKNCKSVFPAMLQSQEGE